MKIYIRKIWAILFFLVIASYGFIYKFYSNKNTFGEENKGVLPHPLFYMRVEMDNEQLITFLKENFTKPIKRSSSTPVLSDKPADLDWSKAGESKKVDEILEGRTNGFYVECGATDGQIFSNTLFFELKRNWTGLLVEANPTIFRKLVQKKRNAFAYNGCLSTTKRTEVLSFIPGGMLGGLNQAFDSNKRQIAQNIENSLKINVSCAPFYSLMLALGKKKIDFFSLNTEGSELQILKTIPFNKLNMELILIKYVVWRGTKQQEENNITKFIQFFEHLGGYIFKGVAGAYVIFQKNYRNTLIDNINYRNN